jgi:uncharacterized DUF497 family protein
VANCIYRTYIESVEFSWDSRKSEANLAQRAFDFAFATLIFGGPTLERAAGVRRIISARRSNRREREAYEGALEGR